MEQPLTVQQELTYKEYLSAMLYVFASSKRAKWYLIGIFGLIMVSNLLGPGSITAIDLITMLAPLVMMILLFVTFITIACYYIYKSKPYLFHHVSYVFTDWGVVRHGERTQFSKPWKEITRFKESKAFFFLYAGKFDVHIFPKKMFADEFEMEHFKDLVKENNLKR